MFSSIHSSNMTLFETCKIDLVHVHVPQNEVLELLV